MNESGGGSHQQGSHVRPLLYFLGRTKDALSTFRAKVCDENLAFELVT